MAGKILLVLGILGLLLGGAVAVIALLMLVTGGGRTSTEEAMMGIIPGCGCSFVSLVLAVVGLVLVMKARKKVASMTAGTVTR